MKHVDPERRLHVRMQLEDLSFPQERHSALHHRRSRRICPLLLDRRVLRSGQLPGHLRNRFIGEGGDRRYGVHEHLRFCRGGHVRTTVGGHAENRWL